MVSPQSQRNWEAQFTTWAQSPKQTEQERCDRSVTAVKKAICASKALENLPILTYAQGSYANRTNVRQDSDVDICIDCSKTFYYHLPPGLTAEQLRITPATYLYPQYRQDVDQALRAYFGEANVDPGNKAFDIHENTYRVDADAVAVFQYRHYYLGQDGLVYYHKGTALITDRQGNLVTNFPDQHYKNGVAKNEATHRRFKALTRIVKNLRNMMEDDRYSEADPITSFLVEGLVWNWPNELFDQPSLQATVEAFLAHVWGATKTDDGGSGWHEVNGIKLLFGPHNEWTRLQVHQFAQAAYAYIDGS